MNTFEINEAVKGIMNKMISQNPEMDWNINCIYSDGRNKTVLELGIFNKMRAQCGKIAYISRNGRVLNYYYSGFRPKENNIFVIDLLLDIFNFEQTKLLK